MIKCETCGSTDMHKTLWMTEDYKKVPILRCNVCGYCNSPKIEKKRK